MNLIRKFILFFIISSVIPMLSLWFFMYKDSRQRLNIRYQSLMNTATVLVQEHLANGLERLEVTNMQASLLAIDKDLKKLRTSGNASDLEYTLNALQKSRDLELVALINTSKGIIASTDTFEYSSKESLGDLFDQALKGKTVSSIEQIKLSVFNEATPEEPLLFVSVTPVQDSQNSSKINGALLIAQKIDQKTFASLSKIIPALSVDVEDNCSSLMKKLKAKNLRDTTCLPIFNYQNQQLSFLKIHVGRELDKTFKEQNYFSLFIYLMILPSIIVVFGFWFHSGIVQPMNRVSESCDKLGQGKEVSNIPLAKAAGEVKNIINSFNKMISKLKENDEMKDNFISTLTHDLKTPLIAQTRVYDLLEDSSSHNSPNTRLIAGLKLNNEHLLNMVNTLLETYKYEHGDIQLNLEVTSLENLIDESLSSLKVLAEAKNIRLLKFNEFASDQELTVKLDSSQMKRVLINIISNAIENIPSQSQITVAFTKSHDWTRIKITDNGPGIDEKVLPYIFERYFSHNNNKKKIGSGLGLYICKVIVEKHNGRLEVESQINKGTSFIIELPN